MGFFNDRAQIPSPGGKVARVSGSEEECGRQSESWQNVADLHQYRHEDETLEEAFRLS